MSETGVEIAAQGQGRSSGTEGACTGSGPLFMDPDPDKARAFFRTKRTAYKEKVMSVREAVAQFVHDGAYIASGGFGSNRLATSVLHEIVRQKKRNLGLAGHTCTHDFQILVAGNRNGEKLLSRVDVAYIVGLEARGLSAQARRVVERGDIEICEWSNYALAARFKAAAMGVPFLPVRTMMGTDTFRYSAGTEITCPFTGKKVLAVPALYPDVALVHVHECDRFGNARILATTVADVERVTASKRVIMTTEKIIPDEEIRRAPYTTTIPATCVDAVCEVPYGAYPANMPGLYYSDEDHLREWLTVEKDEVAYEQFLERCIYGVSTFEEYLDVSGARQRLPALRALELLDEGGAGS